ncbi:MAG: ATP-binding cassette domain-containing protein, partial [Clostridia bacterium]|nr:ATP-binding cassette domain-containing protein [Clostridia bacterium]
MENNIIEVKNVTFEYSGGESPKTVIKDFNIAFQRGSFTVILGRNGSGKSTLAKLLNGLYKPTVGDVFVDSINTKDEATEIEIKRRVGMVFQNPDNQLLASIVEEDVAFGPENL